MSKIFRIAQKKIIYVFLISCFSLHGIQLGSEKKPFVVVLDAGHGGKDSGNRGNGYYEKNIALSIVLKIGEILEKNADIKVIYTRKSDVFLELSQRADIANKADADLFISVHCDAFRLSQAFGAGTFVLGLHANERNFEIAKRENSVIYFEEDYEQNYDGFDPNNPESVISLVLMQETYLDQSIIAANTIQKSFVSNLNRKDRTVKQAGFLVLRNTYMPSVLVETGFLTNPKEGAYLNSEKGRLQMGDAIAKAIIKYKINLQNSIQETSVYQETPEAAKEVVVEKTTKTSTTPPEDGVINFRVQISASKNSIPTAPYNFRGLKNVYTNKNGTMYRYYYGRTEKYKTAQKLLKTARRKGYKSAFIVAFKGNVKIKLQDALKAID